MIRFIALCAVLVVCYMVLSVVAWGVFGLLHLIGQ